MIDQLIIPPVRTLGDGIQVRRALPAARCRSVGPFVFFDEMGPFVLSGGAALDVRPHPHIGLATMTYLFEGEIVHRDSLGVVQRIRPGEVNWMVAGRGIAHSERTPVEQRGSGGRLSGIQIWIGLPQADEEIEPSFVHHPTLPRCEENGASVEVVAGEFEGQRSPVKLLSETFYLAVDLAPRAQVKVPHRGQQRAIYVVEGSVAIGGKRVSRAELAVLAPDADIVVRCEESRARLMIFGGAPLDGERHVWWNFVSSRRERIAQAAQDWRDGRFASVPGESEFIPLPDNAPVIADYP